MLAPGEKRLRLYWKPLYYDFFRVSLLDSFAFAVLVLYERFPHLFWRIDSVSGTSALKYAVLHILPGANTAVVNCLLQVQVVPLLPVGRGGHDSVQLGHSCGRARATPRGRNRRHRWPPLSVRL